MAKSYPTPIRFDEKTVQRLDAVAAQTGISRSKIMKICVHAFLEYFEAHGQAALPLNWAAVLESMDGRTRAGKSHQKP